MAVFLLVALLAFVSGVLLGAAAMFVLFVIASIKSESANAETARPVVADRAARRARSKERISKAMSETLNEKFPDYFD